MSGGRERPQGPEVSNSVSTALWLQHRRAAEAAGDPGRRRLHLNARRRDSTHSGRHEREAERGESVKARAR